MFKKCCYCRKIERKNVGCINFSLILIAIFYISIEIYVAKYDEISRQITL